MDRENTNLAKEVFEKFAGGKNEIDVKQLGDLLEECNVKIPGYKIRDLMKKWDLNNSATLDLTEYMKMVTILVDERDGHGVSFKSAIKEADNVKTLGGTTYASTEGTTHSIAKQEVNGFSEWLNIILAKDTEVSHLKFPIKYDTDDLFLAINDGIILCKLINVAQKGTIDERAINKKNLNVYKIHENMTLAINSAAAIGVSTINIGAEDIISGVKHICLGLIWQIIKIGLFANINIQNQPGLVLLLKDGETIQDLNRLPVEEILLRWANYQLELCGSNMTINNFTSDIKDSVAYSHIIHGIAPISSGVDKNHIDEPDMMKRADKMLNQAEKIDARQFISAYSIVNPIQKLNVAFMANLFNQYPNLNIDQEQETVEETREAKSYRNWMNSLGVKPFVYNLYSDLYDGLIIFQLFEIIKKGIVDWSKVNTKFSKLKSFMERVENCNYAVQLGKELKFSLVGIQGKDIYDGIETLLLAFVWQLMKAYTLSILKEIAKTGIDMKTMDKAILSWANEKLSSAGSSKTLTSFGSSDIKDSQVIFQLIEAISPGATNKEYIHVQPDSDQQFMENASYAVTCSRKIGAHVYALPEDIIELKSKMIMTIVACLMIRDMQG